MLCHKDLKVEAPSFGISDKAEQPSWFGVGIVFREGTGPKPVHSMAKAELGSASGAEHSDIFFPEIVKH